MQTIVISLLIANLVTIAAASTVVAKEINKLNKRVENLEESVDIDSMGKELKGYISKEFMGLSFRGLRLIK